MVWAFLKIFCCASEREEPIFAPDTLPELQEPSETTTPLLDGSENVLRNDGSVSTISNRSDSAETMETTSASVTPSKAAFDSLFKSPKSSSKIVRRISSMSTKEHREFRFFLPILNENDTWIDEVTSTQYKNAIQLLLTTFKDTEPTNAAETRHDSYLIGKPYFGITYNDEKKLEMKARTENKPIWMEKWSTVRFGSKALEHYRADIISYLNDVGHKDAVHEELIDHPRYVDVDSMRHFYNFNSVYVEVSDLTIRQLQISPTVAMIPRKHWLTIIVGGDNTAIEKFVRSHHDSKGLWKAIQIVSEVNTRQADDALHHSFVPVISGYPAWLRLVSNSITNGGVVNDDVNDVVDVNCGATVLKEVMPAVESFLSFLALEEDDIGEDTTVRPFE